MTSSATASPLYKLCSSPNSRTPQNRCAPCKFIFCCQRPIIRETGETHEARHFSPDSCTSLITFGTFMRLTTTLVPFYAMLIHPPLDSLRNKIVIQGIQLPKCSHEDSGILYLRNNMPEMFVQWRVCEKFNILSWSYRPSVWSPNNSR